MTWRDLLFMHWPVPAESLRPLIPPALQLDAFEGRAWLGVVPFRMEGVRPRYLPSVRGVSSFPELNLRTYVTPESGGKPGVWFFSLDAHNPLAVRLARTFFHLPYFDARMRCVGKEEVFYESVRTHRGTPGARFSGRYKPTSRPFEAAPGTLEHFLTARYCLYSADKLGRVYRGNIHHAPWSLQHAEAEVEVNTLSKTTGVSLPATEPHLLFSRSLEVVAWLPRRLAL